MRTTRVLTCTAALALVVTATATGLLHAQAPATGSVDPNLAFEAASVKVNKSGERFIQFGSRAGRFVVTNAPLRDIVRFAYGVQPFQLIGLPSWADSERFDIVAKSSGDVPPLGPNTAGAQNPIAVMVQNLLAERFKLKAHREQREMPIYALTLARADGKLGPNLKPAAADCNALMAAARAGGAPPQALQGPPKPGEAPPCGMFMSPASIAAGGVSMTAVATALGQRVGRSVVDKTGLTGEYQFVLNFTPDQLPPGGAAPPGQPPLANGAPFDPNAPSLVTAIQEQLGLKLDAQRGPVEVVVIDSVERPIED